MAKCKGCGAEIIFVKTPKGKDMPLDAKKELVFYVDEESGHWRNEMAHRMHWLTCPKVEKSSPDLTAGESP